MLATDSLLQAWGSLAPLAEKVAAGQFDGFELPYELASLTPVFWPDGTQILRYRGRGLLLFREPKYENYGYASSEEFAEDVKKSQVVAKSIEGAISIGRARLVSGQPLHLSLQLPELPVALRFLSQNMVEARMMQQELQSIFPMAKIRIARSELALLFGELLGAGRSINFSAIAALPKRKKQGLWMILLWALFCMALNILGLIGWISVWFEIGATALFSLILVLAAAYLLEEAHIQNFLETFGKKKGALKKPAAPPNTVSEHSSAAEKQP